jgi:hypothetical protein
VEDSIPPTAKAVGFLSWRIMSKSLKVKTKGGLVTLTDKDYKAAGGQGVVYCKGGLAYKIYHDPATMIPVAKIHELSVLKSPNILGPIEPIFNPVDNMPIGFTMRFIEDTEFLCKIFTRNFRTDKNVSVQDIVDLVVDMQKTLEYIHKEHILVVDYNELNFLLSKDIKIVYCIDVDSWQTPHYHAAALMESVRDHRASPGKFTELTDWFSWAIVTFQMYTGAHPYKGFHPKYRPNEWGKRMEEGASVFDKGVMLPPACQDFSVIPKKHLEWYKAVFMKNERSIPPYPDAVMVSMVSQTSSSRGQFVVDLIMDYPSTVRRVYFFNGKRYAITNDGVYCDTDRVFEFKKSTDKVNIELCQVLNEDSLVCYQMGNRTQFFNLSKISVAELPSEAMMAANGLIYSVSSGELVEHSFERLGKLIHQTKVVCSLCPSYKIFPGIIAQDDFMKCHLAIPYEAGMCVNIHVPELDGFRIIDARSEGHAAVLLAEKTGIYWKYVLCFDHYFSKYTLIKQEVDLHSINFVALPSGIYVMADDEVVTLFNGGGMSKEMKNAPINATTKLYHEEMSVFFTSDEHFYRVKMS